MGLCSEYYAYTFHACEIRKRLRPEAVYVSIRNKLFGRTQSTK